MKSLRDLKKLAREELPGKKLKVALLGDTATQLLVTAIKGETVDRGIAIDLYEGEYSQVERQLMDPTSDLYQYDAEVKALKVVVPQNLREVYERVNAVANAKWHLQPPTTQVL